MKFKCLCYLMFVFVLSSGFSLDKNLRLLQSNANNSQLIFPLIRKDGKFLLNMSIGSSLQNVTMMIDTAATQSLIYVNRINSVSNATEIAYDISLSSSYSSNSSFSSIDKFYFNSDENNLSYITGTVSLDTISLADINNKTTVIPSYEFLLNQDDISKRDADGFFTLARITNIQSNWNIGISLLNRLSLDKNIKESFTLINDNDEETESISYIAFGDVAIIKENPLFTNLNNLNLTDSFVVSSCDIIQNNTYLSGLWSCSLSGLNFEYEDETEKAATFNITNTYFILDTGIDKILVPEQTSVLINGNDQPVLLIEHIMSSLGAACNVQDSINSNSSYVSTNYDSLMRYKYIQCMEEPDEIEEIGLLINGISYEMDSFFSEIDTVDESGNIKTIYIFDILFYQTLKDNRNPNDENNSYWILGNEFIDSFNAVTFDQENKKIIFFPDNSSKFPNKQESMFSFFFLSLLCVFILIVIVFLVPYIIYRRRRKVLMEKLQYEIIYKKMNEISRDNSK